MTEGSVILPHVLLTAGGFIAFCVGAFGSPGLRSLLLPLSLGAAAASGLASLLPSQAAGFQGLVDGGAFARYFNVLFAAITMLTLLFADRYSRARGFSGDEFYGLILFGALGMLLTAGALHWLIFFLGIELLSISLYVLIGIRRSHAGSGEAALKYFVMGSFASGFLTFGIAILYASTGVMNIAESLGRFLATSNAPGLMLGVALLLVGLGFKISLAPFHLWTADVYQGAPAPVTAFLSTGSKVAMLAALLRIVLSAAEPLWNSLVPVLWGLSALTMAAGNITALRQSSVKRLLAYSSVAQMGYLTMALLAARGEGASAVMFYAAVYALMDLGAFGALGLLSGVSEDVDDLEHCRGLGVTEPWKAALLAVCLFSLAGFPPTAGFVGKFMLFAATFKAGYPVLAVLGILTAIVSIYYYVRVVVLLFMSLPECGAMPLREGLSERVATGGVLALVVCLGILPSPLLALITRIVAAWPA